MKAPAILIVAAIVSASPALAATPDTFADHFDDGLEQWQLVQSPSTTRVQISVVDSGDDGHGNVLELQSDGVVVALAKKTPASGPYRIEADFKFPVDGNSYLGIVYGYADTGERTDFGCIYVKGDRSYLRVNPFRDGNASRLMYEEYRTNLAGERVVGIGSWHHIAAEVDGNVCHVYVGDMTTPAMTFDLYEGHQGLAGFSSRVVGSPVWVDDVEIRPIERLSWQGSPVPDIRYVPEHLLTKWDVAGPFTAPVDAVERGSFEGWRPFETDRRGAVVSGRVIEYTGKRPVAYFRTVVDSDSAEDVVLHTSATEELALFVNGVFKGYIYRNGYMSDKDDWNAWWDFATNPDHAEARTNIRLDKGRNEIVLRSRAGQFASGGFFAAIE